MKLFPGKAVPKASGTVCQLISIVVIVSVSAMAISTLSSHTGIYPLGYHTLGWFLALFFPFVAICFILFSLRIRLDEITDHFAREKLWRIYASPGEKDPEDSFKKLLWKRLGDYYDLFELATFSLLAATFTFIIYYLVAAQFALASPSSAPLRQLILHAPDWAVLTGSGFLGSLSGAMVFVLRRYRMYDLRPVVFLQVSVAIVAGTFSGPFVTMMFPKPGILGAVPFMIGFLSAINIDFLPNLMRAQLARLTGTPLPDAIPSDMTAIINNAEVIESLNTISIFSVRELASIDPLRLYLNMPQQIEIINTIVDQALLHFYFPSIHAELEQANIQRFSQLLPAVGCKMSSRGFDWPERITFIDGGGTKDSMLLAAVRGIVEGHEHHCVLGLLCEKYRKTFFAGVEV